MDRYEVQGWFEGETDCDPPEPGKRWLSVVDADGEEVCILVQRKRSPESSGGRLRRLLRWRRPEKRLGAPEYRDGDARRREAMARRIAEALDA